LTRFLSFPLEQSAPPKPGVVMCSNSWTLLSEQTRVLNREARSATLRAENHERAGPLKKSEKLLVAVLFILTSSLVFFGAFVTSYSLPVQDLAQYWAAAHLFPHNPYSPELTKQFEQSAGIDSTPLITKMPPWALILVLPLSLFSYHVSFAAWALMSVVIIIGCSYALGRRLYRNISLEPAVLPFLFGPTVVLLMLGQFT